MSLSLSKEEAVNLIACLVSSLSNTSLKGQGREAPSICVTHDGAEIKTILFEIKENERIY